MNTWLLLFLLSLSTYRLTRLVVKDTFPPVLWLRDNLVGGWREATDEEVSEGAGSSHDEDGNPLVYAEPWSWSPYWLGELLSCPWCASGWLSLVLVLVCLPFASVPLPVLFWLASWALGSLLASQAWA